MQRINLARRSFKRYRAIIDADTRRAIRTAARNLRGLSVAHINAAPKGGGVAEILTSLVPLMEDLGLEASWWALEPDERFFTVTKSIHNGLQGKPTTLSQEDISHYWYHNGRTAAEIKNKIGAPDVIVLHDAQVLPMASFLDGNSQLVWHCHVDLSAPDETVRSLIAPATHLYSRCILSMPDYIMAGMPADKVSVFPPAIDPLTRKNAPLSLATARCIIRALGVDTSRPLITQVSRFDRWKDPWGVIDAYRLAKRRVPQIQLALVGILMAQDDPEGASMLDSVRSYAGDDPDIHLFADPQVINDNDVTVNAFQTASTVIVQKSTREGFGLTVTEAMWKGTPVIGGDCGGIRLQIEDGVTGYLVSSPRQCAKRILQLLASPEEAKVMAAAARKNVRQRFLLPRLLLDYFNLFRDLSEVKSEESRRHESSVPLPVAATGVAR
ncbi:MAG: glycosyltransferase [Dehalococcoidia bacterium]